MARLIFVTHPEVAVDPDVPVTQWALSQRGIARAQAFARSEVLRDVAHIWSSAERKAQDTAAILSSALGVDVQTDPKLGENDRSATGFLPPDHFETAADAFFAQPDQSFEGWETARAAQARIVLAVTTLCKTQGPGDILIVSHGAVGTLLYCHLSGTRIDRMHDQPHQGHYWIADRSTFAPLHAWQSIG
ncbi:phosphoglycerate mutase family protein [Marivita sp. S6314]|uniref:histidine phosphatase family protein n=1 Tax=Marivita sp. S6314 TaxID=2926406 RepID=UPI001FF6BDA5|nr:histidine phosphatase family protein [Marivita sp. S6314]MCK0149477.1 phosphoglycerate mutase family protein [Marivita sp. S6314]